MVFCLPYDEPDSVVGAIYVCHMNNQLSTNKVKCTSSLNEANISKKKTFCLYKL